MSGALVGGTIYVAGGQEAMKDATATRHFLALDLSARNDPTDFKWRELPAWPGPPRILPIAVAQSDRFYLFSGRNIAPGRATGLLTDAYSYDPASANWTPVANIAAGGEPRCVMAGTGIASGADRVLIFGGASAAMFRGLEQLSSAIQWTPNEADAEVLKKKQRRILENHPGFSRDILSYNTVTDTWRKLGELPTTSHVTTTATRWGEWIVIPSGEIRPGVRTPKLWKASESVPTDGADTRQ
jgi:N-acetylneuraminic acid mutarotase